MVPKALCFAVLLGAVFIVDSRIIGRRIRNGEPCSMPGFFADADDCRIFYRCAEHPTEDENNPHLIRYTFRCPNGTVFDEALSTCNHPDAVMDKPANCQVYDPDDGQSSTDGMDNNGSSGYSLSFPSGNLLGVSGNTLVSHQVLQPQQQQHQLVIPGSQIIYLPSYQQTGVQTLGFPFGNVIQVG